MANIKSSKSIAYQQSRLRPVSIMSVEYSSPIDAAKVMGISDRTVRRWLSDPDRVDCYYLDEKA